MRRSITLAIAAILALPLGAAGAAGLTGNGGATALSPGVLPREVRITVPVEISNYPSHVAHPGAGPIKVNCVLYVDNNAVQQIASAVVPFDPTLGVNSYQGKVTVSLSLPRGKYKDTSYLCQIIDPATDGMPLDTSASMTEMLNPFTP